MKYINLEKGKYYHIFNRGNNKENIFREDENYRYFLKLYMKYIVPKADTFSYCLLPNHFHFLLKLHDDVAEAEATETSMVSKTIEVSVSASEEKAVWQPFSNFFNAYSKAFNKMYSRTGSLFQYKFKRNEIDTDEYFRNVVLYIHNNPVKHGMTIKPDDYKNSSYLDIIENRDTFINKKEVLKHFDTLENFIFCHRRNLSVDDRLPEY